MAQVKSKKEPSPMKLQNIGLVVLILISLATIALNIILVNAVGTIIKLQQAHFNTLYNQVKVLDLKTTNDESSRNELKEYYNIDYKKD